MTSFVSRERSFPYRGTTLTTLLDSRLTVLATAPPQPASNDFASTRAFVPGGPEPSRNGLGNLMPLTVIERSMLSPWKRAYWNRAIGPFGLRDCLTTW